MAFSDYSGSSLASSYGMVSADARPNKPLIVKCTFDRSMRRITFASAQNCSFDLLKTRVEQCFSLYASSFLISYKDDDGEVTDITCEDDLTEAIQYFHLGDDLGPASSGASTYSGRSSSSGASSRKITLRVDVQVDYDGPSLSDTASLSSLEEYRDRRRADDVLSLSSGSNGQDLRGYGRELGQIEEDVATIASRPTIAAPSLSSRSNGINNGRSMSGSTNTESFSLLHPSKAASQQTLIPPDQMVASGSSPAGKAPTLDTQDVFTRLKAAESAVGIAGAGVDSMAVAAGGKTPIKASGGGMAQWLKDQSVNMMQSVLGVVPTPPSTKSESVVNGLDDQASISLSSTHPGDHQQAIEPSIHLSSAFDEGPGALELELEQGDKGNYYYTYTGSMISHSVDDRESSALSRKPTTSTNRSAPHDPTKRISAEPKRMNSVSEEEGDSLGVLEQIPEPPSDEFLRYLPPSQSQDTLVGPDPAELTECSSCNTVLEAFRYVCATCGPRPPRSVTSATDPDPTSKGKGRVDGTSPPPLPARPTLAAPSTASSSSGSHSPFTDVMSLHTSDPFASPQHSHVHNRSHSFGRSTQLLPNPTAAAQLAGPQDRSPQAMTHFPPSHSPNGSSIWSLVESIGPPGRYPASINTSTTSLHVKPLPDIPPPSPMAHTYPPPRHSPASSFSSTEFQSQPPPPPPVPFVSNMQQPWTPLQPLSPYLPPRSPRQDSGSQKSESVTTPHEGFELCPDCMETAGIEHASESTAYGPPLTFTGPFGGPGPSSIGSNGSSGLSSPGGIMPAGLLAHRAGSTSSLDSAGGRSWKRSSPWKKGQLRHAFKEKVWAPGGWIDVEHDEISKCTTCGSGLTSERYKCATCLNMVVCRGCYSQIHEIHPIHAFVVLPEMKKKASEPVEESGERSLLHDGLTCSHCLMEIVGARFHCAICPSVDICSNCESAGLPGNLTSPDGGHDSSHIMIKVPFPLTSSEVDQASRRALLLWTGRDGPNLQSVRGVQGDSVGSIGSGGSPSGDPYADTVIGLNGAAATDGPHGGMQKMDHGINCKGCRNNIMGVRYQCACCPSPDGEGYSLCQNCEARSYQLHDPMHCFFKIPRPVDRKIQEDDALLPPVYILAAGESLDVLPPEAMSDPRAYLQTIVHRVALCDRCIQRISGEWYHCAYCAKDLCDECEAMDSHDASHLFVVFKSVVDMAILRTLTDVDNPQASQPLISYPVYTRLL